jgi:hypothetical protein
MKKIYSLLLSVIFSIGALAQWSSDPAENLKITNLVGDQAIPKIAVCDNGDYYVGFFSAENGNYNVRLHKLDSQGNLLWPVNGILISSHPSMTWLTDWDMTCDNENHAILTWQDIRSGGNNNIVAYRISPSGEFVWGADGIMLSNSSSFDVSPKVTVTAANNAVIAWQSDNVMIRQKLSPAGEKLWGVNGITMSSTNRYSWPQLMPVGEDDVLMKFYEDSGPAWAPTRHILAQRFNSSGQPVWPANAIISNAGNITAWTQILSMQSDENGGFYIVWPDYRISGTIASAWLQHINASGQPQFQANGVKISENDGFNQFYPLVAKPANDPNVYVYWNEVNGDQNIWGIYGQKISPAGSLLWGNFGKEIYPLSSQALLPLITMPAENDVIMIFEHYFNGVETSYKAVRLNSDGEFVWEPNETMISSVQSTKIHPVMSDMKSNQWVFVWEDDRTGDVELFAQNLQPNGEIGPVSGAGILAGTVTIEGNMLDATEIVISAGGLEVNPLADGTYTLDLEPGNYTVTATHPYTADQMVENVVIENGETTTVDFNLTMLRTNIECFVFYSNVGIMPIENATVTVSAYDITYSGTTNFDGFFIAENVPYGFYTGMAYIGNPQYTVYSDTIIDGANNRLDFAFLHVSVNENEAFSSISIAPNPVNDQSSLVLNVSKKGTYNFELLSSEGKMINEKAAIMLDAGMNNIALTELFSLTEMKPGMYLIQISDKHFSRTIRFIVN